MELQPYCESWADNDPHANFKADVTAYTLHDPLPTLQNLSAATGVPLSSLVRYVLVKYVSSGADALLAMPPIVLTQMDQHIQHAEDVGTDEARLVAYESLKQMIAWLKLG